MPSSRTLKNVKRPARLAGRSMAVIAGASALALALAGCSGASHTNASKPSAGASGSGKTFDTVDWTPAAKGPTGAISWALYAEPTSLDYTQAYDYPPNTVLANVCDSLFRTTPDNKIEPALALSSSNPDPLTWVYELRPNVKFHDGTIMTADDVVASLKRQMDPSVASAWSTVFKNVASINKTGPLEVTIKMNQPDVLMNELLASSAGTIESAAYLQKEGQNYGNPQGLVDCTGPYSLDSWKQGDSITLKKFADYWDPNLVPKNDSVKFVFITDNAARTNALKTGAVDGGYLIPNGSFTTLDASGQGKMWYGPNSGATDLAISNFKGTLSDVRVRQALSMALDRKGIVNAALNGVGVPAQAGAAHDAWGLEPSRTDSIYASAPPLTYDVNGAKKLIQQAGATGKTITIATSTVGPEVGIVANAVQSAGKAIGLNVVLKPISPDNYTALFVDPNARAGIDLLITNAYDSQPDPLEFYQGMHTGDFANYGNYSNPQYDAIYEQAVAATDPAARDSLTEQLQNMSLNDMAVIPVYEAPNNMFLNKRLTGAPTGVQQLYYPWAATIGSAS